MKKIALTCLALLGLLLPFAASADACLDMANTAWVGSVVSAEGVPLKFTLKITQTAYVPDSDELSGTAILGGKTYQFALSDSDCVAAQSVYGYPYVMRITLKNPNDSKDGFNIGYGFTNSTDKLISQTWFYDFQANQYQGTTLTRVG